MLRFAWLGYLTRFAEVVDELSMCDLESVIMDKGFGSAILRF